MLRTRDAPQCFLRAGKADIATFVCTTCGKHITLQPNISGTTEDYGEGAQVLRVLGISRPRQQPTRAIADQDDEQTLSRVITSGKNIDKASLAPDSVRRALDARTDAIFAHKKRKKKSAQKAPDTGSESAARAST